MTKQAKERPPVWAIRPKPVPRFVFPTSQMIQDYLLDRAQYLFRQAAMEIGATVEKAEEKNLPHRGVARFSFETTGGVKHYFGLDCYAQTQRRFSCCLKFDREPEYLFSAEVLKEHPILEHWDSHHMQMTLNEFLGVVRPWSLAAARSCDN